MAIARVQKIPTNTVSAYSGSASSLSVTFSTAATTTGNAIVCGGGLYNSGGASTVSLTFSDDQTPPHSWTKATDGYESTVRGCIAYVLSITGKSSHQITITPSSSSDLQMGAVEISGIGAYQDKNEAANASGPGAVTSSAGDYCFARADAGNTVNTISWSGSTIVHEQASDWDSQYDKIVSTGGSESPTWSTFYGDEYSGIVRFSAAGAAATFHALTTILRTTKRRASALMTQRRR